MALSAGSEKNAISTRVLPPYNNNLPRLGKLYHIQTEDLGPTVRAIATHVFCEGRVIDSQRSSYPLVASRDELQKRVKHQMREQHRTAMKGVLRFGPDGPKKLEAPRRTETSRRSESPKKRDQRMIETAVIRTRTSSAPRLARPLGMVPIPAATLLRGARPVLVEAYYLDVAPVTNRDYLQFMEATHTAAPQDWVEGRLPQDKEDHPVVGVTLADARRYAAWRNKRLPTELEWEAAALASGERAYPWGDGWSRERCCCRESGSENTSRIGAYSTGISFEGCADLYGNVWEWVEIDPRGERPEAEQNWVMGGAFNTTSFPPHRVPRTAVGVDQSSNYLGFRCAAYFAGGISS